jgi:biopolymer transport protein ExbD
VSESELRAHLRAFAAGEAQGKAGVAPTRLVVNADKGVLHERVVEVLDLARESGVREVLLAVEPRQESSQ